MKSKFIVCLLFILAAGSMFIVGCDHNTYKDVSSNYTVVSSQPDTIPDIVSSTSTNDTVSTPLFNEHLGEITDGVFTSTDGIYQVTIPQNVNLITATDTTTVFSSDDGNTSITISSETNNGQYQDLSQQNLEAIYQQLYTQITVTDFSITEANANQTNYRLSFTGLHNGTTTQVYVYKAITDRRVITIQVSASSDKETIADFLDVMADSLIFS